MAGGDEEARRHALEVAYWLDQTGGRREEVDELIAKIAAKRGVEAAARLRQGMRDEWTRRYNNKQVNNKSV